MKKNLKSALLCSALLMALSSTTVLANPLEKGAAVYDESVQGIVDEFAERRNISLDDATIDVIDGTIFITVPNNGNEVASNNAHGVQAEAARGVYMPNTAASSRWDFDGYATGSRLYTDRYITGFASYEAEVTNRSKSNNLTINFRRIVVPGISSSILGSNYVLGADRTGYILNNYAETSHNVFMSFEAPSDFYGFFRGR